MLNAEKIKYLIHAKYPEAYVRVFDTVDSTNTRAKETEDFSFGIICARSQTAGRGRLGRSFYSPEGTGLYMSLILPITPKEAFEFSLTAAAAVAGARAIERLCGISAGIKWVNDLYINDKKVAGILTEGQPNRGIVGIGINVSTESFPPELKQAGSLGKNADLSELAAAVALELFDMVFGKSRSFMPEYRRRSILLGKEILYLKGGTEHRAKAVDIDAMGRLVVQDALGAETALDSGEVRVIME